MLKVWAKLFLKFYFAVQRIGPALLAMMTVQQGEFVLKV
jgi:hypothetical protein